MKKLVLLSLGLLLLLAAPAWSQDETTNSTAQAQDAHAGMDMNPGALSQQGDYSDKIFLSMMIPHHSGAIAMCKEILKTTKDPQIKGWAESMGKAQKDEIVIMLKWLENLGRKDKPTWDKMSEHMQAMREHTLSDNADMNFALTMIQHHALALEMAYPALLKSADPKIVDLARDILMHQTDEIRAMRNWLDEKSAQ